MRPTLRAAALAGLATFFGLTGAAHATVTATQIT